MGRFNFSVDQCEREITSIWGEFHRAKSAGEPINEELGLRISAYRALQYLLLTNELRAG